MAVYDVSTTEKKAAPSLVAGATLYADNPLGTILPFGGSDIPSGWLLCDGATVSRTTYSELFAVIGESFGVGDGSTTFNLPDMRESVPKGAGLTGHTAGAHLDADGLTVGEFLDDQLQAHTHSNKTGTTTPGQAAWTMFATEHVETATEQTNNGVVGRFGATTEVKSVGVNYIIKAKMASVPADFLAKVDEIYGDINKAITVTPSNSNIVVSDARLVTNNLAMVSGYIKNGTQLAFNTSQVAIGTLSVSGRNIRGTAPCSLFLYSLDLFGTNGPNTIQGIWKTNQNWLSIGRDVTNDPRLSEDCWFTAMLPLE